LALKSSRADADRSHRRAVLASDSDKGHTDKDLKRLFRDTERFWNQPSAGPTRIADSVHMLSGGGVVKGGVLSEDALSLLTIMIGGSIE
jgi:hypothetical protein